MKSFAWSAHIDAYHERSHPSRLKMRAEFVHCVEAASLGYLSFLAQAARTRWLVKFARPLPVTAIRFMARTAARPGAV